MKEMIVRLLDSLRLFLAAHRWVGLLWSAIILILCLVPSSGIPRTPVIPFFDKIVHMGIFAIWSFTWTGHYRRRRAIILLTGIGLGLLIEFLQEAMKMGRSFEWLDLAADATGALAGILLYGFLYREPTTGKPLGRFS